MQEKCFVLPALEAVAAGLGKFVLDSNIIACSAVLALLGIEYGTPGRERRRPAVPAIVVHGKLADRVRVAVAKQQH